MSEVAELAGVSTATVSRVLNRSVNVNEETRQRVLTAMQELAYTPNVSARDLRRGTASRRTRWAASSASVRSLGWARWCRAPWGSRGPSSNLGIPPN